MSCLTNVKPTKENRNESSHYKIGDIHFISADNEIARDIPNGNSSNIWITSSILAKYCLDRIRNPMTDIIIRKSVSQTNEYRAYKQ